MDSKIRADTVRMDATDRPPLGPYAYEKIAKKCHEVEKGFWSDLSKMRVERPLSFMGATPPSPQPPKLPEHLRWTIRQYAGALFRLEAGEYPEAPEMEFWFSKLAGRVVERVMNTVATMDQTTYDILRGKQYNGLGWHGLTLGEMRDAAWEGANADKAGILNRLLPDSAQNANSQIGEPDDPRASDEGGLTQALDTGSIAARRLKLLNEYKAAAGEPSSKRIYESSNAKIHKPEFYEWLRGTLPEDSRVTRRFEAFLTAKKRPIPKNPAT